MLDAIHKQRQNNIQKNFTEKLKFAKHFENYAIHYSIFINNFCTSVAIDELLPKILFDFCLKCVTQCKQTTKHTQNESFSRILKVYETR